MKIDMNKDLAQSQLQNAGKGQETADARVSSNASSLQEQRPASSTNDTLDLSETAVRLSQLDAAPVDNSDRIAELKAAIDNGTYEISPSRIADKLIDIEGLA